MLKRAATAGDGWLTYFYTPEAFTKSWTKIRTFAQEAGKDLATLKNAAQLPIMVGPSRAAIQNDMMDWLNKEWDFPSNSDCSRESAIMGTVDECVEQLEGHHAVGVQKIIFVPYKYEMGQVETIAPARSCRGCAGARPRAPPLDWRGRAVQGSNNRKMFLDRFLRRDRKLNGERVGRRGTKWAAGLREERRTTCSAR